ncbi:hypothetical protein [Hyphomonas sp.]|uniref:hypothetical protein n=1 Tax=Hyphomonas sp. TaxID=87 RepID=UPI00391DF460
MSIEDFNRIREVDEYASIDLSTGSEAYQALMNSVSAEAGETRISLSGDREEHPGYNMTSSMIGWYNRFVGPARRNAIAALNAHAQEIELTRGAQGE